MKPLELLNLIAVFVAPIAAVIIGQLLQDFSEKRKDKMRIFQCLMTHRATGWGDSFEAVNALNSMCGSAEVGRQVHPGTVEK